MFLLIKVCASGMPNASLIGTGSRSGQWVRVSLQSEGEVNKCTN